MAHLVSSDRNLLLEAGRKLGMAPELLQYKPLKHPATLERVEAWHWDLRGEYLEMGVRAACPQREPSVPRATSSNRPLCA